MLRINGHQLAKAGRAARASRRALHTVPEMHHLNKETGIPGLLSPKGLDIAWFQYQQHLVNQLNQLTQNTGLEDLTAFQIIQELPNNREVDLSQPGPRILYQIAAQVYNNEFFFQSLKESTRANSAKVAEPTAEELRFVDISKTVQNTSADLSGVANAAAVDAAAAAASSSAFTGTNPSFSVESPVTTFENYIRSSFDSFLSFRELFVNKADAMFGAGNVWLVQDPVERMLFVVNTYNSGTPFDKKLRPPSEMESSLVPLLNMNTWEHVYLHDYGFSGKRRFIENAFDCINWSVVLERMPTTKYPRHSILRNPKRGFARS